MTAFQRFASLVARLGLAAIFIHSGFGKLADPAGTAGALSAKHMAAPLLLAIVAGSVELVGGLLLAVGWKTRWAALALALFLIPTTLLFHNPSGLPAAQAAMQEVQLFKNLAIFGGLMSTVAWGAGLISLDAVLHPEETWLVREAPALRRVA